MAAGDVPPHFALNPSLNFGYHYFLLLLAAQFMRIGSMFPWSALDLGRGLILVLPLMLAALWAYRFTRQRMAGALSAFMLAFAGGAATQLAHEHLRVHVCVLGVEYAAGDAAGKAGHHLARTLRVDHFGGDAQGARLGSLGDAGGQAILRRVQVEPALLLVAERLAAGHGELGEQVGTAAPQRSQHRHQGSHALLRAGAAEEQ